MKPFNIRTSFLSDEDADRLYERRPELKEGVCPTCLGRKTYRWQGQDHDCDCGMQLQLAKHYSNSGIIVPYQGLTWDDYKQQPPEELANYLRRHEDYISQGIGFFFTGKKGTGKSLLSTLVLKELIHLGYTCFSTTYSDTVEAFSASWNNDDDKRWFARKFMRSDVLLLDDIGKEWSTRLSQSTFDMILRSRVQDARPTFITTNLTIPELESGYGSAVLSLLSECSIVLEFSGEDYRPQAYQRKTTEINSGERRPLV